MSVTVLGPGWSPRATFVRRRQKSGWLSPVEIDQRHDESGPAPNPTTRRASQKGFLEVSLADYLALLDWTGRQLRRNKRGSIPAKLAPILDRIGIEPTGWCDLVKKFGRLFKRAVGTAESLLVEAERRNLNYMQAPGLTLLSPQAE